MIRLYTVCACRYDLIELQLKSFQKHIQGDFEFIVFNNSQNPEMYRSIGQECQRLGLKIIDVQRDQALADRCQVYEPRFPIFNRDGSYSEPGVGNEYSLCWAWENVISHERDMVCLMHHDCFLIGDLNVSEYLSKYDLCYVSQARPGIREYMWECFVLLNLTRLPQPDTICWMGGFMTPEIAGDTSCVTSKYLDAHPELKIYHIATQVFHDTPEVGYSSRPVYEILYFAPDSEEFPPQGSVVNETRVSCGKPTVLHYTSASNWDNQSQEYHRAKTDWLRKVLERKEGMPENQIPGDKCNLD